MLYILCPNMFLCRATLSDCSTQEEDLRRSRQECRYPLRGYRYTACVCVCVTVYILKESVYIFSSMSWNNTHMPICTLKELLVVVIISPLHTGWWREKDLFPERFHCKKLGDKIHKTFKIQTNLIRPQQSGLVISHVFSMNSPLFVSLDSVAELWWMKSNTNRECYTINTIILEDTHFIRQTPEASNLLWLNFEKRFCTERGLYLVPFLRNWNCMRKGSLRCQCEWWRKLSMYIWGCECCSTYTLRSHYA